MRRTARMVSALVTVVAVGLAVGSAPEAQARAFRVYEGTTVVARNTTTHATVTNLGFGSRHTFTVTAVSDGGRESAHSAAVSGTPGIIPPPPPVCPRQLAPPGLVVTAVTASSVSLHWPYFFGQPHRFNVSGGGQQFTTTVPSARIGGLVPATTYTFSVGMAPCPAQTGPSITVTTAAGSGTAGPGTPTAVTLGRRTENSVGLSWTAPPGADRAVRYAVYEGETRVAASSDTDVIVRGLFHDTAHEFTVAAIDVAGNESAHSVAVSTTTLVCQARPPAPVRVRAMVRSASSVALSWVEETAATEFTVLDGSTAVLSTLTPSAAVTGLASASRHRFRVVAALPNGCGNTPAAAAPTVTTRTGPAARLGAPTRLRVVTFQPGAIGTVPVTLGWDPPAGSHPVVDYRVYEGATVVATGPVTTVRVPVAIPTTHRWSVTAVDAAGNESAQSEPVTFTMPIITPPFP